jgi:hypothetical protein
MATREMAFCFALSGQLTSARYAGPLKVRWRVPHRCPSIHAYTA